MNIVKRFLILGIAALFGLQSSLGFSYFQQTFYCTIDGNALQIASTYFGGSKLCLRLVAQLKQRKTEIVSQLDTLKTEVESNYNISVKSTLFRQGADIDKLNSQILSGVYSLEARIFTNNKKKYFAQLKSIRLRLIAKQAVLSADLAHSIADGQVTLVSKIIATIGFNYQRIKLIEGVLSSKSLDEMMPLLDIYKGLIESQVTGKSE